MKHFISPIVLTTLFFSSIFFKQAHSVHLRHLQTHQVSGSNVVTLYALNNRVISLQQGNPFFASWKINYEGEMYPSNQARRVTTTVNDCLPMLGLHAHRNMLISWTRSDITTWRILENGTIIPLCIRDLISS